MTVLHLEVETARKTMQVLKRLVADLNTHREMVRRMGQQLARAWQGPAADEFQYHLHRWSQRMDQVLAEIETLAQLGEREVEEWVAADRTLTGTATPGASFRSPSGVNPPASLNAERPTPYHPEHLYAALDASPAADRQTLSPAGEATFKTASQSSWDTRPWMQMAGLPGPTSPEVGSKEPGGISDRRETFPLGGKSALVEPTGSGGRGLPPGAASPAEAFPAGSGGKSAEGSPPASNRPGLGSTAPMPGSIGGPGQTLGSGGAPSPMDAAAHLPSSDAETSLEDASQRTFPGILWAWLGLAGVAGVSALGYLLYRMTRMPAEADDDTLPMPGPGVPIPASPELEKTEDFLTLDAQAQNMGRAQIGENTLWLSTGLPPKEAPFSWPSVTDDTTLNVEKPHPGSNRGISSSPREFE